MFIYGFLDSHGRIRYVGKTTQSIAGRFSGHKCAAKSASPKTPVGRWLKKHLPLDDFNVIELVRVDSGLEDADFILLEQLEIHIISQQKALGDAGLNVSLGGGGLSGKGELSPNFGRKHSQDTIRKMRSSQIGLKKGIKLSQEHRSKIRASMIGDKNPMFGKSLVSANRKRVQNVGSGEIFDSITEAAMKLSLTKRQVSWWASGKVKKPRFSLKFI
jgi:hypothetical protein